MELTDDLRYPIGAWQPPVSYDLKALSATIGTLAALPAWLDHCIENLDAAQPHTPYRPGGWTVNQVIHHLADSHMHAFIRLKLALTEDAPVIKPYDQDRWSLLADVQQEPVNVSITLLHALHRRWTGLLRSLTEADWQRSYYHPEQGRHIPLWEMTLHYAWHSRHHMEQIRRLRQRMNW
jgi:hypothetical protein